MQLSFLQTSETTVESEAFPMEMQVLHRNARGDFLVLSVLFSTGARQVDATGNAGAGVRNAFLEQLGWSRLPLAGQTFPTGALLDLSLALPEVLSYYTYVGSLSTPPCTEGVVWVVLDTTVGASLEQLSLFPNRLNANTRPTQPLNSRPLFRLSDAIPAASWAYSGSSGPGSWAKLGFSSCANPYQSPIDIIANSSLKLNHSALELDWTVIVGLTVTAEANMLRVLIPGVSRTTGGAATDVQLGSASAGSSPRLNTTFEDRQYQLEAIEFHAASEHRFGGKQYPLEAQFVHRDANGLILVRAIRARPTVAACSLTSR